MNSKLTNLCVGFSVLTLAVAGAGPAYAQQTAEVKSKPPLYTYVANFALPRNQFPEWDKSVAANEKIMETALADGSVVAFGEDKVLVHTAVGFTHADWWSATSMAGIPNVLDQLSKATDKSPALAMATKHADDIYVSCYYNWHPGSVSQGYLHSAVYMLKPEAPHDTVQTFSNSILVPLLEKLFADGAITAYQVATQAIHTDEPGTFYVFYISSKADGLDKVNTALTMLQSDAISSTAFGAVTEGAGHRDALLRTNASFK